MRKDRETEYKRRLSLEATQAELPKELTTRNQWVCWRYIERNSSMGKLPLAPEDDQTADVNDPKTWGSFQEVVSSCESGENIDGIGFVLTEDDSIIGVDVDDCIDERGQFDNRANGILSRTTSYAEISPSGRGIHVFVSGDISTNRQRRDGVEVYDSGRYFTVTGTRVEGSSTAIEHDQEFLNWITEKYLNAAEGRDTRESIGERSLQTGLGRSSRLTDEQLLAKARNAQNSEKFCRLFDRGDVSAYESRSEADLALCSMLAFWSNGDAHQIDRLFRDSELMRDKWTHARGKNGQTYGQMTVSESITRTNNYYDPTYND